MIKATEITKTYISGRGRVLALRNVSFSVAEAEALVIMGKSGSGKTTLLQCLGGLETPDTGGLTCFGIEIHTLSTKALSAFQRRNLGIVFQSGNLISYLNVFDNIAFPLVLNQISGKDKDRRVQELLGKIGLAQAGRALPGELSGGEIQRVSFARAIAHRPRILLADEPTASLDSETGRDLIQLMFSISTEQKCTLVIATHDQELAASADQILQLKDGRIVS